jgi:hypothetical protein
LPPKVTSRVLPGSVAGPASRTATCVPLTVSGPVPNTFDSVSRTALPPALSLTTLLIVWSRNPARERPDSAAPTCALLQVPTHWPWPAVAGAAVTELRSSVRAPGEGEVPVATDRHGRHTR